MGPLLESPVAGSFMMLGMRGMVGLETGPRRVVPCPLRSCDKLFGWTGPGFPLALGLPEVPPSEGAVVDCPGVGKEGPVSFGILLPVVSVAPGVPPRDGVVID
jgi:hypothetical protein